MVNIAVIVPVYKAEAYIARCVDSILSQTYPDFILVLVDDGSPDRSGALCDAFAEKDTRVHVLHQANGGPSSARNRGIDWVMEHTGCAYLSFVDSDDCLHPDFLRKLHHAVCSTGAEAAMCAHRYIGQNEDPQTVPHGAGSTHLLSPEALMVSQATSFNYPWGKLFPRACFAQLRYPEDVSFGEDNLIIYKALFSCQCVAFLEESLYLYYFNAEGITKSPWSERSLQVFLGIEAQMTFYRANGYAQAYQKEIELYIQQCAYQIHRIRQDKTAMKRYRQHLNHLSKTMRRLLRENPQYRLKDNFFWFQALYPRISKIYTGINRIHQNLKRHGFKQTIRKLMKRLKTQSVG